LVGAWQVLRVVVFLRYLIFSPTIAQHKNGTMPEHLENAHLGTAIKWTEAEELRAYSLMVLIRRFEEKVAQLYAMGDIAALPLLSIGQEAVAVGVALAAAPGEACFISAPRPHGIILARGLEPGLILNALLGGASYREACGALDVFFREYGATSSGAPLAAVTSPDPAAHTAAHLPASGAALWWMGAGEGTRFVIVEQAALARNPIVFVIETTTDAPPEAGVCGAPPSALFQMCRDIKVPAHQVSGLDVRGVKTAADAALSDARGGKGPMLLEVLTYRYQGHALQGRAGRAGQRREQTDPIALARARIARIGGGMATEARLKDIEQSMRFKVSAALLAARGPVGSN